MSKYNLDWDKVDNELFLNSAYYNYAVKTIEAGADPIDVIGVLAKNIDNQADLLKKYFDTTVSPIHLVINKEWEAIG